MQTPVNERGKCVLEDDMEIILTEIDNADYLVIGAPVNFNNFNALSRTGMDGKIFDRRACGIKNAGKNFQRKISWYSLGRAGY